MYSTKTIIRRVSMAVIAIFITMMLSKASFGQRQEGSILVTMSEFQIKQGHNTKFREGVKAWKACYLENEGTWHWNLWNRLQGEGNVYVLSSESENWAAFDERDEAGRNCRDISRELISPHIESSTYYIARTMPASSNSNPMGADTRVLFVSFWTVNNNSKFMEAVNEVHKALKEKEGNIRGYWSSSVGGGPDDFDYMVVSPYKNFSEMDEQRPGVWTILESSKGKKHMEKTRDNFRESVDKSWSYIYTWVEDLSRRYGAEVADE